MKEIIKAVLFIPFILVAFFSVSTEAEEHPKVIILYSLDNEIQMAEDVNVLNMLVGHFTSDITIAAMQVAAETEIDLNEYSHVFYMGLDRLEPTETEVAIMNAFEGPKYFIGNHMEYFAGADDLRISDYGSIDSVIMHGEVLDLPGGKSIMHFESLDNKEVLMEGKSPDGQFPLIFREDENFNLATDSISGPLMNILGESLFDFFESEKNPPKKFLRLEDIHPKSDPVKVKQIGDYLAERNIPYAITVIPVYTNPETGQQINIAQAIELVSVLKEMQDNGATIVQHGYFHQYRETETGEGFEYWDVENDRPIYQEKNEPVFLREDFDSHDEYEKYIQEGLEFEKEYIYSTIKRGVSELVEQGLYPLAFEAPHYSMSETGYEVLAEYFSTYVGEIQISNRTYDGTYVTLFDSQPTNLHGMRVLPETMSYINPDNPNAVQDMAEKGEYVAKFSNSYLAFFYHPYLGLDKFEEVMAEMEIYEHLEWFNMKDIANKVEVDGIIVQSEDGNVSVQRPMGVLVAHTMRNMWWFAIPVTIFLLIIALSVRNQRGLKDE